MESKAVFFFRGSFVDEANVIVRMQSSFDPARGEFACPMQLGGETFDQRPFYSDDLLWKIMQPRC